MKIAVWVNAVAELEPRMTTTLLAAAAAARGHEVWVIAAADLGLDASGRVTGPGRRVSAGGLDAAGLWALARRAPSIVIHDQVDAVLIRTNPARDRARTLAHEAALGLAELLRDRGVAVINDPSGLRRTGSKLYLARLSEGVRPRTALSGRPDEVRALVAASAGPSVLKPLFGTRGEGVFKVTRDDPNLGAIVEALCATGPVLVQDYVEGAEEGDLRVILLEGRVLVAGGREAAVRRVPARGEFRSNVHLGGSAAPGAATPAQRATAAAIGARLLEEGVLLAGLDLIGHRAVEVNVFSTGGLWDAGQFCGVDFMQPIIDMVERRAPALAS
ncbi:MAG: hypothetical protein AB7N76_16725 [Planctomycetota bacterium]